MKNPKLTFSTVLLVALAGCAGPDKGLSLFEENDRLKSENARLIEQIQKLREQNQQLAKRIETLQALPEGVKGAELYTLSRIKLSKYTNLYDRNNDGKKDTLKVYIEPIDADGDLFKAPGRVQVQLWDLEPGREKPLLGQWQVEPWELSKLWFSALLGANYRLTYDVREIVKDPAEPLTVKVAFTDILSGKVFKEQLQIQPRPE